MRATASLLTFVLRRMRRSWRLQLLLAVGILLAAVLMAATPIYTRAVADLSLTVTLRDELGDRPVVESSVRSLPLAGSANDAARAFLGDTATARLDPLEAGQRRIMTLRPLALDRPPRTGSVTPPIAIIAAMDGAIDHVLLDGALPTEAAADGAIPVALPVSTAESYDLGVGDKLRIRDHFDECDREPPPPPGGPPPPPVPPCTPTTGITRTLDLEVTALIHVDDPFAGFWSSAPNDVRALYTGNTPSFITPLLVHPAIFDGTLKHAIGSYLATTRVLSDLDTDRLNLPRLDPTRAAFDLLRADLRPLGGDVISAAEPRLETFREDLNFTQVPILLLMAQVVGIALLYVFVVASVVVEYRRDELFSIRSRGAALSQVLSLTAVESLAIAAIGIVVAPLIAAGAISALGWTDTFKALTDGSAIDPALTAEAWLLAAVGAATAILFILLPLLVLARGRAIAQPKHVRPTGGNVIQRYYLDFAIAIVAIGLLLEAQLRGTVYTRDSVGGLAPDPLLLTTPALFGLVATLAIWRAFPWAVRLTSWLTYDRAPLPVAGMLRYVSRNVGPPLRLMVLLVLVTALGTFAASYAETIERSLTERIEYAAGVDIRGRFAVEGRYATPASAEAAVSNAPGAEAAAAAYRNTAAAGRDRGSRMGVDLLALNPAAAESMLFFREDFAGGSLGSLMDAIEVPPLGQGVRIGDDVQTLRVALQSESSNQKRTLWMRFRDAGGQYFTLQFPEIPGGADWQSLDGGVASAAASVGAAAPYTLHSVIFTEAGGLFDVEPPAIRLSQIEAVDAAGNAELLHRFSDGSWLPLPQERQRADAVATVEAPGAPGGERALEFQPAPGRNPGLRGVFLADPAWCTDRACVAPLIASQSFLDRQALSVGDRFLLDVGELELQAVVAAGAELFATLRPDRTDFVLMDYALLSHVANISALRTALAPNEMWILGPSDPVVREELLQALRGQRLGMIEILDLPALLEDEGSDPLTTAGGSGILIVAFIAITILLGLAFLVSLGVAARQRTLEMALLRTMGASRFAILGQLVLEYAVIAAGGVAAGVFLGIQISGILLSQLEVTTQGGTVLPPFVVETDWRILAVAGAVIGFVILAGVAASWRYFVRLRLSRELRLSV